MPEKKGGMAIQGLTSIRDYGLEVVVNWAFEEIGATSKNVARYQVGRLLDQYDILVYELGEGGTGTEVSGLLDLCQEAGMPVILIGDGPIGKLKCCVREVLPQADFDPRRLVAILRGWPLAG